MNPYKVIALLAITITFTAIGLWAEGEGVEQKLVTWSDPASGFSIQYPETWTHDAASKSALALAGGDGSMTVDLVASTAGDVQAFARSQQAPALDGYKQLGLAASKEVKGAWVLSFAAKGSSSVTGRSVELKGDRYFLPFTKGKYAMVTVISPKRNYDREGVRDIALSFRDLSGGKR